MGHPPPHLIAHFPLPSGAHAPNVFHDTGMFFTVCTTITSVTLQVTALTGLSRDLFRDMFVCLIVRTWTVCFAMFIMFMTGARYVGLCFTICLFIRT